MTAGVRNGVRNAHTVLSRLKRIGDCVAALSLVDGALSNWHARRTKCGNLVDLRALRNRELEISILLEICGGRVRVVRDGVLLTHHELVPIGLEHEKP